MSLTKCRPNVRLDPHERAMRDDAADFCQLKTKQQESDDSAWMLAVVVSVSLAFTMLGLLWWAL